MKISSSIIVFSILADNYICGHDIDIENITCMFSYILLYIYFIIYNLYMGTHIYMLFSFLPSKYSSATRVP